MATISQPGGGGGAAASDVTPLDVDPAVAAAAGSGSEVSREDHRHDTEGVATSAEVDVIEQAITPLTTGSTGLTFGTNITPGTTPNGQGSTVAFSPDGSAIAVGHAITPFISVYLWDGVAFGSRVQPTDGAWVGTPENIEWAPDGTEFAVHGAGRIGVYAWNISTVGDGVLDATGAGSGEMHWNAAGDQLLIAETSDGITVIPWSGSALGTKVTQAIAGDAKACAWSRDGSHIFVGHTSSPFISAYPWSGTAFGTVVSNPSTLPPSQVISLNVNPSGNFVGTNFNASPFVRIYEWDEATATWGAAHNASATLPTSSPNDCEFARGGGYLASAETDSPYLEIRPVAANGDLGDVLGPAALPGLGWDVAFSPDGLFLAIAHTTTPFVSVVPGDRSLGY